ncbi:MAG: hypothetical protein JOY90_07250 [Bradyrhizobium sp.]|uniref:hypothetical protein n=1 Tax=Bradyrhizobium sp. TaxID=376 RepID=UPI001D62C4C6|nr:hypothetical protein [Bradyrhizobium sp.]MBV9560243.1 hypothetical protein [Bradyrhizobium sp.]
MLLTSAAFAQSPDQSAASSQTQAAPVPAAPPRGASPEVGSPLLPGTDTGLDKVASDGISTKTVPAAPCTPAARETDGFTTCAGIPGPVRQTKRTDFGSDTTTGLGK